MIILLSRDYPCDPRSSSKVVIIESNSGRLKIIMYITRTYQGVLWINEKVFIHLKTLSTSLYEWEVFYLRIFLRT